MKRIAIILGLTKAVLAQQPTTTIIDKHQVGASVQEFINEMCQPGLAPTLDDPYVNYQKSCKTLRKIEVSGKSGYTDAKRVFWRFQNGKAAFAVMGLSDYPCFDQRDLQRTYGEPTSVKTAWKGIFIQATWYMPDGAVIDSLREAGKSCATAWFYSSENPNKPKAK